MSHLKVAYKNTKSSKHQDAIELSKILVAKWERRDEEKLKKMYGLKKDTPRS